jgi:hypothetical protein
LRGKSAELRSKSDQLLALVTQQAGDAATSAKIAHAEAEAVKSEVEGIQRRIDIASSQLSGIEQQVLVQGPRWKLLEAKKDEFINALKPFAGQKVFIMYCGRWGTVPIEPFRLAQDLMSFLGPTPNGGAGLQINGGTWDNCSAGGGSSAGGNLILVSSAADKTVKALAFALDDTLNRIKIGTIQTQADPREGDPTRMQIFGFGSPWAVAAKDPTSVVLLVGDNPMFDVSGWKQRHARRESERVTH